VIAVWIILQGTEIAQHPSGKVGDLCLPVAGRSFGLTESLFRFVELDGLCIGPLRRLSLTDSFRELQNRRRVCFDLPTVFHFEQVGDSLGSLDIGLSCNSGCVGFSGDFSGALLRGMLR
jgi:hypothetical protein